ncbi:MAG: Ig-like domain-containing protein [Anaerolineales bacterium]
MLSLNELVDVIVELANPGNQSEDGVPLSCTIKDNSGVAVYDQEATSGLLSPGIAVMVSLPVWTPANAGVYTLTCRSSLNGDENPANDVYSHQVTVNPAGGADVWTKDNAADTGAVPSGHPWWVSPDIWVRHQADGGLVHQNPVAFQENTVYIRLRNSGQQAASGRVDVFWSRSRIGWPCKLWSPNVGSIDFENLVPGEVRIVSLSWTPQEPGRHGLHTVIEADGDPADKSLPCSPHRPRWDNNVSWRNVIAFFHPPKSSHADVGVSEATVDLVNAYDRPKDVDLVFELHTFPVTGTVTLWLAEDLFDRWLASPGSWFAGASILTHTREIIVTGVMSATVGGLPLEAYERSSGDLVFAVPQSGAFEVALHERIDGQVIGGVTYQWSATDVVPPELIGHWPPDGATDVDLFAPLEIIFSEAIGPLTFDLTLTPEIGAWSLILNEAMTTFMVTHAGLALGTHYTATVMAADASANQMSVPYSWFFTTRQHWDVYLPVLSKP